MPRLFHAFSHDVGIPGTLPFCAPLLARGWDIVFACPIGAHAHLAEEAGMRVLPLALRRSVHPPSDVRGALQLYRHLRAERPDIVHTHNLKVGHLGRVLAWAARAPIIVHTLHGMGYSMDTPAWPRRVHTLLEWIASRPADVVLAQSEEDRSTMIESGAIEAARVEVIGNGIDLSRFRPGPGTEEDRRAARAELGLAGGDVLFLTAGRLVRPKGVLDLIEAAVAAARTDPRVRLAIAGESDSDRSDAVTEEELAEARAAGVLVLGRRGDMPRLYAASDVVVLASWQREGLPRVLMEGAAMGKPLLATSAPGCREIVRPPDNGLLVPVRDVPALTRAMLEMAGDPGRRARWGAFNAKDAPDRYDVHQAAARVVAVYDRLLAAPHRSR